MKIGFCMLLWAASVTKKHRPILADLKATGYDGVEIPVFAGEPDHYARLGRLLDEIGLERTTLTVIPAKNMNPLSENEADRKRAVKYLKWAIDCSAAVGSGQLAGPLHQTLGHFSGRAPTKAERLRARAVHRTVGDYAAERGVVIALEAVNRFESYFVNTMDDLAAYLDLVAHPAIKGTYDTFHANLEEADPVAALTRNRRHVAYVHISENDRGVPGRGHVPWAATFRALKESGCDGWLTIEAFGRALPDLAAATRVWRDFAESPEAVYRQGFQTIRTGWDAT